MLNAAARHHAPICRVHHRGALPSGGTDISGHRAGIGQPCTARHQNKLLLSSYRALDRPRAWVEVKRISCLGDEAKAACLPALHGVHQIFIGNIGRLRAITALGAGCRGREALQARRYAAREVQNMY